jgi:hypothetical protein
MPWSLYPLYHFFPTETNRLSAVRPRPKWLQRDGQVDPHNLARVVKCPTIFEKGDDKSRHRDSGTI